MLDMKPSEGENVYCLCLRSMRGLVNTCRNHMSGTDDCDDSNNINQSINQILVY